MTLMVNQRRLLVGCAVVWIAGVARDLRRARRATRLDPPAARIDVHVDAPSAPTGSRRCPSDGSAERSATIRLVALGDSSVAGVGATRLSTCLAVQIAERVALATGCSVHVRGYGVSGARTVDVALQVQELGTWPRPDAIVVVVGANDVAHATPPWRYVRALHTVYGALRERLDSPVIACSLPEFRVMTVVGAPLRVVAVGYGLLLGRLQRLTLERRAGVRWVDGRRLAGPAFRLRHEAMAADGYHPSDLGYTLLADALAPAVVTAVGRQVDPRETTLP